MQRVACTPQSTAATGNAARISFAVIKCAVAGCCDAVCRLSQQQLVPLPYLYTYVMSIVTLWKKSERKPCVPTFVNLVASV